MLAKRDPVVEPRRRGRVDTLPQLRNCSNLPRKHPHPSSHFIADRSELEFCPVSGGVVYGTLVWSRTLLLDQMPKRGQSLDSSGLR